MRLFDDLQRGNPGFTFSDAMRLAHEDFEEGFLARWGLGAISAPTGLDHDEWREANRVYGIAQQIARIATTLLRQKGVGAQRLQIGAHLTRESRVHEEQIEETMAGMAKLLPSAELAVFRQMLDTAGGLTPTALRTVFYNALHIEATKLLSEPTTPESPTIEDTATRLEHLVEYLVSVRGEGTKQYLRLVARCYCLDLRTELAVMARAVLDCALQDYVTEEIVRKALTLTTSHHVTLSTRIKYLKDYGLVTPSQVRAMEAVTTAGNQAVHVAANSAPAPDVIMSDLVTSLNAVEQRERMKDGAQP